MAHVEEMWKVKIKRPVMEKAEVACQITKVEAAVVEAYQSAEAKQQWR